MHPSIRPTARQGFSVASTERLPLPARDTMTEAQRAAAAGIITGPRKAIFGPFVPLLQSPVLMEWIGKTGEALRFGGSLPERIRELAICIVARETSNQFDGKRTRRRRSRPVSQEKPLTRWRPGGDRGD